MKTKLLLFSLLTISSALSQALDYKMKPGLWEVSHKTEMNGKDMSADLAKAQASMNKMPAEQRKMLEKMMKGKGVDLSGQPGKAKVCYTEKMIQKRSLMESKTNCKIENQKELSDGVMFSFKCKDGSGQTEYHLITDNSFVGKTEMKTKRGEMIVRFDGKFLDKDCGDIQPFVVPE